MHEPIVDDKGAWALAERYFSTYPGEAARALAQVPVSDALHLLTGMSSVTAAGVFERLDPDRATAILDAMDGTSFGRMWSAMDAGAASAMLARLPPDRRASRLAALPDSLAAEMRELMSYPAGSAHPFSS